MKDLEIRVHLAAVDPLRARAMTSLLDGRPDLTIVGTSGIGPSVPRACLRGRVEIALVLAGPVPIEVLPMLASLRDSRPRIESVVLAEDPPEPAKVQALLNAGARGILSEDVSADEIVRAARSVVEGGFVLGASATQVALERASRAQQDFIGVPLEALDIEILELLASGSSSSAVAERLGIDAVTVRSTLRQAKRAFGERTQEGVVAAAIRRGLI